MEMDSLKDAISREEQERGKGEAEDGGPFGEEGTCCSILMMTVVVVSYAFIALMVVAEHCNLLLALCLCYCCCYCCWCC